jgi:hypothetical protein
VTDKKYIIKIEGQEIPIPEDVGVLEDADLKRALTPMFPGAANSKIERAEKDGTVTITVVKLAGAKGSGRKVKNSKKGGGFAALLSCKSHRNPAIEFYLQLHGETAVDNLDPHQLISLSSDIDKVLNAGQQQLAQAVAAHARLCHATPQEGLDFVPVGF